MGRLIDIQFCIWKELLSALMMLHYLQYVVPVGDRFVLDFQAGGLLLFYFGSMSCFGECSLDCIGVEIITNDDAYHICFSRVVLDQSILRSQTDQVRLSGPLLAVSTLC